MDESTIKNKKLYLQRNYNNMNNQQLKAIFRVKGPVLILAGAGSGKTTVLVNRISYMLKYGNAFFDETVPSDKVASEQLAKCIEEDRYDDQSVTASLNTAPINPWNILAITFTNKSATELKERLKSMLGEDASHVNAGTFHSICMRILRREIEALSYQRNFTIYDTQDTKRVIKDIVKTFQLDEKMYPINGLLQGISKAKDSLTAPFDYLASVGDDFRKQTIGKVYVEYQKRLKSSNALDFDDLICKTVELFSTNREVLDHYQNLYKYIMVDEYQDTNKAQYMLIKLLSQKNKNLCVVGDDDQSIYKFRGATIENILNFEQDFDDAVVIKLEQNYRSTQNILNSANAVISNNQGRKGKNLWTEVGEGDKVIWYTSKDAYTESQFVVNAISQHIKDGQNYSDNAILYRTNAQSANHEQHLIKSGYPYRIFGGNKFFDRKEIKDILSYFQVIANHSDATRLKRIINEPKRGIGASTVEAVEMISLQSGLSMVEVMGGASRFSPLAKKATTLLAFYNLIQDLAYDAKMQSLADLLDLLMDKSGYRKAVEATGKEGESRLENIEELRNQLVKYEEDNEEASIESYLEEVALYTDLDKLNQQDDSIMLMTIHSAKGLEFKNVFVTGMEEGLFPSYRSMGETSELEEERRLAYVALTRAREKLFVVNSAVRMMYGKTESHRPSIFLREIPEKHIIRIDEGVAITQVKPASSIKNTILRKETKSGIQTTSQAKTTKVEFDFVVGDKVEHSVFGVGVVLEMKPMAGDTMLQIEFDTVGVKKLMGNYTKLTKK